MSAQRIVLAVVLLVACDSPEPQPSGKSAPKQGAPRPTDKPKPAEPPTPKTEPEASEGPPVRADGTIYGETELMGTRVSINLYLPEGKTPTQAGQAMQAALDEMARIERVASEWQPDSELSRLNAIAGRDPVPVSDDLYALLERSKAISQDTGGAFDVTFHGVGQLWSFKPGATPPSTEAIERHLPLVDWTKIVLKDDAGAHKAGLAEPGMKIGLGAIAKGYAVDRASAVLEGKGFHDHVVEAGGDTYARGSKGGQPWKVGVQNPQGPGSVGMLPSSDIAVVTSGNYQRYFEHDGKRYAHILDPRTGWPLEQDQSPRSVTLLASNATDADGYCTAITVMGTTKGMAFVNARDELEAVIIDHKGKILTSSGLGDDRFVPNPDKPGAGKPDKSG